MTSGVRTRTSVTLRVSRHRPAFRPRGYRCRTPRLPAVAKHLHGLAARLLAAAGQPGHPAELFEHLLHLHELLQQTIDIFDRRAAARRDALASAAVDDVLLSPLFGRHRADDRFDAANLLLVRLVLRERLEVA